MSARRPFSLLLFLACLSLASASLAARPSSRVTRWGHAEVDKPTAADLAKKRAERKESFAGGMIYLSLAAGAVALVLVLRQSANARTPGAPRPSELYFANPHQRAEELQQALDDLRGRDPRFQEQTFLWQARAAFEQVLNAWSLGNLEPAAHLMSDGVLRRFLVEQELDRHHGVRNVIGRFEIDDCRLAAAETDECYDVLHVGFTGKSRERDVPADTADDQALQQASRAVPRPFDEIWSFVRRRDPGAAEGQLTEGKCPSCGAPIARSSVATCDYCQAILNSGAHDWVLSEITETGDFFCRSEKSVGGWAELRRSDPQINRQVLEDRASLVFWKWIETRVTGSPQRFARLCTPAALERLELCSDKPPRGFRRVVLGDVQLLEVEPERGRAHLMLYWRTAAESWELPRKSMLTMERDPALTTRADTGMATDRCHRCAGFQRELDAVLCEWCGALLPADWSFANVVALDEFYEVRHATEARAETLAGLVAEEAAPGDGVSLVASMVAMARADDHVLESERRLVDACARRFEVSSARVESFWQMPLEVLNSARPRTGSGRRALLRAMVAAALADGGVSRLERGVLSNMATRYGVDLEEVVEMLDELSDAAAESSAA